ncbi:MAG: asparagine synthase (glutamine-hydrolyzing) [Candidatus Moranbacteria bacterium]|nr:asparagine synthase (glutamine-hydrolyzing) [Candidatus Moranbacteria bacterium]
MSVFENNIEKISKLTCGISGKWDGADHFSKNEKNFPLNIEDNSGSGGQLKSPEDSVGGMLDIIAHRGPDAKTIISSKDSSYVAGQSRLAIVGLREDDMRFDSMKSMEFRDGEREYILTFNGEIYNYRELQNELIKKGYVFETETDTEVLLKFLVEYGIIGVERLDGQFAFAFRDSEKKEIYFARDRTGKKPLYYYFDGEKLYFASEPNAIVPEIGFDPNMESITSFFIDGATFAAGEEPIGESIYKDIAQLKPGEIIKFDETNRRLEKNIYAVLPIKDIVEKKETREYIQDLRINLEIAIRKRVAPEVQMGAALSGGLDSSIVTLITADELKKYDKKLIAASIFYTAQAKNEDYKHAKIVADTCENVELFATEISPENFLDNLEEMVKALGIQDSIRQLAMYANYKKLKENGVKVAVIGEGADEFNWGYWHKFPGLREDREECSTAEGLKELILGRKEYVEKLVSDKIISTIDFEKGINYLVDIYNSFETNDSTRRMMGVYALAFMGFLNKANDRLSMANSIEARAPYQDNKVVETCLNIPREEQITENTEKYILREAFKNVLPESIYKRPKEPLPAAAHMAYHEKIAEEFKRRLEGVDGSFWDYFNKETWFNILKSYETRIVDLKNEFLDSEEAGSKLMVWRKASSKIDIIGHEEDGKYIAGKNILTNDVFKLLTTIIWYSQNLKYSK